MPFKRLLDRYAGIWLMIICCVSSIWLAITQQLTLYIHPRYIIFTAAMAGIGLLLSLLSFRISTASSQSLDGRLSARLVRTVTAAGLLMLCLYAVGSLLIIKPATLTTATVNQRGINTSVVSGVKANNAVPLFGGGDYSSFSVQEWASLLTQTNDQSFFSGKTADITGFVNPDNDDPQNVFYVSRFVITCCAVDARPIGVAVYAPGWQLAHKANGWVRVSGSFTANPSMKSQQHIALKPYQINDVDQPKDPYVY